MAFFYSNIETPALWARSEKIGYALNECSGAMESWSFEVWDLVEFDLIL